MPRRRFSFFMAPLEHGFIRFLDDRYRGLLTPAGRALFWASVAAFVLLLGGVAPPLVAAFAFTLAALGSAIVLGVFFRPRVSLERRLPPPPSAGDKLQYQVVVRNEGKRTARQLVIEERGLPADVRPAGEPPVLASLRPGESAEVTLALHCRERGAYELRGLQAASTFPSALFKMPGRRAARSDRLLVYPRFSPLESFEVPHSRQYQPGGIAVASQVGESTEFFGTRDWREGDRPRDVHWPSFARTGRLIVKEFQEEYFVRLALVLDVEARRARDEKLLEKALSLAAGIADALARREYIIDLFAAGHEIFHFQAGRALAHVENILEILACLEPGDRFDLPALEAALLSEAGKLSAVILVMMDWDDRRRALVERLKAHGIAVRVLSVRPERRPDGLAPDEVVELP
jgi:uncharacterized protein (DUF58 family)